MSKRRSRRTKMGFLSPFGLGARMIRRCRRRQRKIFNTTPNKFALEEDFCVVVNEKPKKCRSDFALKPHGRKRKPEVGEETREKIRGDGFWDPDDYIVAREILSRLPVKSLMRFKCVCKRWLFLIQEDPSFISLHLERSKARPRLLITNSIDLKKTFLIADLSLEDTDLGISSAVARTIGDIHPYDYDAMLKPLDGLIGFFGVLRNPGVGIYNLSTRESSPWVKSTVLRQLLREDRDMFERPWLNCSMGYDSSTKEHKVVGIWKSMKPSYVVCEVLTVGGDTWRKIDEVPPYDLAYYGSDVYLDGSIYYTTEMLSVLESYCNNDEPKFIVAFDVRSEKFRAIRVPNIFFGHPDDEFEFICYSVQLLDLNGQLGLLADASRNGYPPKLWLFDNNEKKNNKTSAWTEVKVKLPFISSKRLYPVYPILGTDYIFLAPNSDLPATTCHLYNWKTRVCSKIEMEGLPFSVPCFSSSSRNAIYFESLLSVHETKGVRDCESA